MPYKMLHVLESPISKFIYKGKEQVLRDIYYRYNPNDIFSEMHMITTNKNDLSIDLHKNCVIHYLPQLPDPLHFFNIFIDAFKIARIAKKESVDIIFSQGVFFNSIKAALAAKIYKKPLVVNVIGDYRFYQERMGYHMRYKILSEWTEEFVLKHADMIFCYTNKHRNNCIALGANPTKIKDTHLWVDAELFSPSKEGSNIRAEFCVKDQPIILFVGRLSKEKFVDCVIESMPYILNQIPTAKLMIVGHGPVKHELVSRCKELNIYSSVIFCGAQPAEKIAEFMSAVDAVVCPYSGLVLLEAAASGKPIIAFDIDWHSTIVKHMETGLLVEFKNIHDFSKAVVKVLNDKQLSKRLGKNARDLVCAEYIKEKIFEKESKAYIELIERNSKNV